MPDMRYLNEEQDSQAIALWQEYLRPPTIERHELRWFTKDGKLVAQRNFTDYNAWCDGRARKLFTGKIPICQATERKELFCGKAENPVPNALDDLR